MARLTIEVRLFFAGDLYDLSEIEREIAERYGFDSDEDVRNPTYADVRNTEEANGYPLALDRRGRKRYRE
jgi:hypothetical protein